MFPYSLSLFFTYIEILFLFLETQHFALSHGVSSKGLMTTICRASMYNNKKLLISGVPLCDCEIIRTVKKSGVL